MRPEFRTNELRVVVMASIGGEKIRVIQQKWYVATGDCYQAVEKRDPTDVVIASTPGWVMAHSTFQPTEETWRDVPVVNLD